MGKLKKGQRFKAGVAGLAAVSVVIMMISSGCTKVAAKEMLVPDENSKNILWSTSFEKSEENSTSILLNKKDENRPFSNIEIQNKLVNELGDAWTGEEMYQGYTGKRALQMKGKVETSTEGQNAAVTMVVYDNLNIDVQENTHLQYYIFPSMANGDDYDFNYNQMYFSVDLMFSDGTYLSDLSVEDQNGELITPQAQGDGRALVTNQWNQIYGRIGSKAVGKTIEKILIAYENEHAKGKENKIATYFDDISIYNLDYVSYESLTDYVNILRGTADSPGFSRGLCAPLVDVPHGFNFWAPATVINNSKVYTYSSDRFYYMTVSHEPSYWIGDRGTWQFMVNTSLAADCKGEEIDLNKLQSKFSHDNEKGRAHYYSVKFDENGGASANSQMELTATNHGAVVRFTYGDNVQNRNVILDCVRADGGLTYNEDGSFTAYSDHCDNGLPRMYVYGRFSEKPTGFVSRDHKGGMVSFAQDVNEVELEIATSYISEEQAKRNLELEVDGKGFDKVCKEAKKLWEEKLSIISDVKGATYEQLVSLYSGLYRLYSYPNTMSENVGSKSKPKMQYRSPYSGEVVDGEIYINNGFWDTYRTSWPAYELFTPDEAGELLDGMIQHYLDCGDTPRWTAPGAVNCMVGTSSDVIYGDAAVKGIEFDWENAYKSALKNSMVMSSTDVVGRKGMDESVFKGYAPGDGEKFSWSMEGYINDYGIAQLARKLAEQEKDEAKKAEYETAVKYFENRAKNYTKLFFTVDGEDENDVSNKWFGGRDSEGNENTCNYIDGKFNPFFWGADYTETNAFGMSVSVPFDANGMAQLYGGMDALEKKIDSIFTMNGVYHGYGAFDSVGGIHEQREQREVKLGQYEHNNQPGHHIIYMYNYAGAPAKTQKYVRDVLDRCFIGNTCGQGYIGDEDNGEMSAWYIFSAMGFYPTNVGSDEYTIGSPLFDEMTVNFGGKKFTIKANNNSRDNVYVQGVKLNGDEHAKNYLTHDEIKNGGVLEFDMGATPSSWGTGAENVPTSLTGGFGDVAAEIADDLYKLEGAMFTSNVESAESLVDDTSYTTAGLAETGVSQFEYSFEQPQTAKFITLTSDLIAGTEISSVKVYAAVGASDEWQLLNDFGSVGFEWDKQTIPFEISDNKVGAYSKYMIEVNGSGSLSEIELLG